MGGILRIAEDAYRVNRSVLPTPFLDAPETGLDPHTRTGVGRWNQAFGSEVITTATGQNAHARR
jgi:hypothetical protein